jgi:hypothetical protein
MTISGKSIFDMGSERPLLIPGIELFQGWNIASDPIWSRDRKTMLRVDATHFPETVLLALKIKTFNSDTTPPKTMRILSDGHDPLDITVVPSGLQTVLCSTPVMQPGTTSGAVTIETSATQSPAELKLSQDDRLLGFYIMSVIENVVPLSMPVDMRQARNTETLLASGWDRVEDGIGVWSLNAKPVLSLLGHLDLSGATALSFDVETLKRPEGNTPLQIELWHKDTWLESWSFEESSGGVRTCPLAQLEQGADFEITFRISELASPKMLGISADPRTLGILLRSIDVIR